MSAADDAYAAALKEIRRVKAAGEDRLSFDAEPYRALTRIPDDIAGLTNLHHLDLGNTAVADLAPLASLTALQTLLLHQTAVADLTPLADLTALRTLSLNWTAFADLTPLANLTALQNLSLKQTAVADLAPLASLTALQFLSLNQTAVADLTPLASLSALQSLWLNQTAVADLAPLASLTALQILSLSQTAVADLAPLANLTALQSLWLNQTAVADLAPLANLTALQSLWLNQTAVADLAPLARLTALQNLWLDQTAVADLAPLANLTRLSELVLDGSRASDLRPLRNLARLAEKPLNSLARRSGLFFQNTPATANDTELARLAEIEDTETRARETLAYLNTLPPWPEPYTPKARPDGQPPQQIGEAEPEIPASRPAPLLTLETLIEAQDLAGWRFSPNDGALVLYIRDLPLEKRQEQLALLAAERCAKLLASLKGRTNSGGLRQEVWEEAEQFAGILSDNGRSLPDRQFELWGSLVAIGDLLEANERGRRDGRDKLDLLSEEARAALSTFLAMASNLVRSFPDARAMDDDHGSFARRGAAQQLVMDILQDAVRTAVVSQDSANLIGKVAAVSSGNGKQAEKASTVSVRGLRNLIVVTTLVGSTVGAAMGGFAGGILEDIGGDVSDHFGLGEKVIEFLEGAGDKLEELFDALPPDEAASLRAKLHDFQAARHGKP